MTKSKLNKPRTVRSYTSGCWHWRSAISCCYQSERGGVNDKRYRPFPDRPWMISGWIPWSYLLLLPATREKTSFVIWTVVWQMDWKPCGFHKPIISGILKLLQSGTQMRNALPMSLRLRFIKTYCHCCHKTRFFFWPWAYFYSAPHMAKVPAFLNEAGIQGKIR